MSPRTYPSIHLVLRAREGSHIFTNVGHGRWDVLDALVDVHGVNLVRNVEKF